MKRITLFSLVLSAAACSSSNQPTREEYDDTAQAIASTTATSNGGSSGGGDVAPMADTVSLSLGVMPQGISLMGDGHFQGTRLGVDYNYSLTCKSVAGVVAPCGPTTDQAAVEVAWSGNLTSTAVDASVTRTSTSTRWSIGPPSRWS